MKMKIMNITDSINTEKKMSRWKGFRYLCDAKRYQENHGGTLAYRSKNHPERTKLFNSIIVGEGTDEKKFPYIVWMPKDDRVNTRTKKVEVEREDDLYNLYEINEEGEVIGYAYNISSVSDEVFEFIERCFNK